MNIREFRRSFNLSQDIINVLTDYSYTLDKYFLVEENKVLHKELYEEYLLLNNNLKEIMSKNGYGKK